MAYTVNVDEKKRGHLCGISILFPEVFILPVGTTVIHLVTEEVDSTTDFSRRGVWSALPISEVGQESY